MIKKIFYLVAFLQIFNSIYYASNKIYDAESLYKKKQYSQALSIYLAESKKTSFPSKK